MTISLLLYEKFRIPNAYCAICNGIYEVICILSKLCFGKSIQTYMYMINLAELSVRSDTSV